MEITIIFANNVIFKIKINFWVMRKKINFENIDKYANEFAVKVIDVFFEKNLYITGHELTQLTPSQQVNFFIIRQLFNTWQQESTKFQNSPYFDYDNTQVKEALNKLMNVLSNNIRIQKDNIKPLLVNAIKDTLLLILSPSDFLKSELANSSGDSLTPGKIKNITKYIKLSEGAMVQFLQNHDPITTESIDSSDLTYAEGVIQEELKKLNTTLEIVLEKFWEKENDNFFDNLKDLDSEDQSSEEEKEAEAHTNINDQYSGEEITKTLAEVHQENTENIEEISINEKFKFVNELFDGDVDTFTQALSQIDDFSDFDKSVAFLVSKYGKKFKWDANSLVLKDFLRLVFKKFKKN